ncbi:kinase-like protein [Daldinia sp. FL1419]|nr:kinase-like protein [Daldinia sp. FL1419]
MGRQPYESEDIQRGEAVAVNPDEITQFIRQCESERKPLCESAFIVPSVIIGPASNNGDNQDAISDASGPSGPVHSYPSTIDDRGNSERLRDSKREDPCYPEVLEPQERSVAGTGSWSDINEPDMAKQLRDAMIESADGKKFLPLDKLDMIVTENAIQDELSRHHIELPAQPIYERREIVENDRTQYTSYQKIFAILVLMGEVHFISDFLHERVGDWDLPLRSWDTRQSTFLVARHKEGDPGPLYRLQTANNWSASQIDFFQSQQWILCAPFFSRAEHLGEKVHLYQLSPHDVLPFIKPGTDDQGNPAYLNHGFFSTVRRVKIHPAHHNFPVHKDNPGADFAVKEMVRVWDVNEEQNGPKDYRRSFDQEVQALKRFCQRNERYIVKLLATYEINGKYYLLFPAADGNLMNHWEENPEPGRIPALWLLQECLGIAQGLAKIHKYTYTPPDMDKASTIEPHHIPNYGIHGDIKPQNILWFKKLPGHLTDDFCPIDNVSKEVDPYGFGYLQISDFGTVKFHRYMTRKRNDIMVKGNTYRAPETDLLGNWGSPAIDIWAFGCLYLDMITWYLRGGISVCDDFPAARQADEPNTIEGFEGDDKFYIKTGQLFTRGQFCIVKPRVSEWIMSLRREPRCSQLIHDFLDLIEMRMLSIDPEERPKCSDVVSTLKQMRKRCFENEGYYTTGRPHTWMHLRSNLTLVKAKVRQAAQFIDSHGQIVSLALLGVILAGLAL